MKNLKKVFLKFLIKPFKAEQYEFTDAQEVLLIKPEIFINTEGKLFFQSPAISGEIIGVCEYNDNQKKIFKLPLEKTAIDFYYTI